MSPVDAGEDAGGFAPVRRLVSLSSSFFCRDEDDRVVLQDDVSLWGVARAGIVRDLRRHRRSSGFLYDAGVALPAFTHGLPSGRRGTAQPFRGCGSGEEGQRDEGDGDGPRERGSRGSRRRAIVDPICALGHDRSIRDACRVRTRVDAAEFDRRRLTTAVRFSKGRAVITALHL